MPRRCEGDAEAMPVLHPLTTPPWHVERTFLALPWHSHRRALHTTTFSTTTTTTTSSTTTTEAMPRRRQVNTLDTPPVLLHRLTHVHVAHPSCSLTAPSYESRMGEGTRLAEECKSYISRSTTPRLCRGGAKVEEVQHYAHTILLMPPAHTILLM